MIKLVALVRKKESLSRDAFHDYWIRSHAPLASRIPGMRGYRINVAGDPGDMPQAPYDGSAEIWFDDRASMEAGLSSAQGELAGVDTDQFAESVTFLVCDEHVVIDHDGQRP